MPARRRKKRPRTRCGDSRHRCPHDGKVIMASQGIAERKAALIREESPEHATMHAYCCEAGYWHVGHAPWWVRQQQEAAS